MSLFAKCASSKTCEKTFFPTSLLEICLKRKKYVFSIQKLNYDAVPRVHPMHVVVGIQHIVVCSFLFFSM